MKTKSTSTPEPGDSRLPVCDQLVPQLQQSGQQCLIELARWYESNWHLALDGAPAPSADSVLALIAPDRQEEIRTVLESIDSRYAPLVNEKNPAGSSEQPNATIELQTQPPQMSTQVRNPPDTAAKTPATTQLHRDGDQGSSNDEPASGEATLDLTLEFEKGEYVAATDADATRTCQFEGDQDETHPMPNIRLGPGSGSTKSRIVAPPDIPGYQVIRVLGRGGMGIVYLAHQEGIDRPVALKMILPRAEIDQQALDRFSAEVRAIGRFQHENIVRIYDAGTHQDMPYFSLEYVDGASLAEQLGGKPMDPSKAARLVEPMARAMQVAHDDGVIHRDLKPANVLMTRDGVPKITDFGLAKELEQDQQLSQDGSVIGTPAFMSPEQASGSRNVGPLSDVYGLGALFYCLLTGRPPFQGAEATDTLLQVIHNDPVSPIQLQPAIPKDLETICLKSLHKDPSGRYATAGELADDLRRFLRGEPIEARPVSRAERVWRWCKRNPLVAAASTVAAALALIVMIGGPVSAAVIYGQKREVTEAKDTAEENALLADRRAAEATSAHEIADQNAEKAAVQERNALDALRSMTLQVKQRMSGRTDLIGLRKELLQTVENGVERMDRNKNFVREHTMLVATIHVRLGDINFETGRYGRALEEYQKCLAVFTTLRQKGGIPRPEENWSKIYEKLGDAARMTGDFESAEQHYQMALDLRRKWAEESPSFASLEMLAISLGKVGSQVQVSGKLQLARETMEEAVAVRERLFKARRNANNYTELLLSKVILAKAIFQQGAADEGIELAGEVADEMRDHAARNPQSGRAQANTAMFDAEMAVMQLYMGQTEPAQDQFRRASDALESLLAKDPASSQVQEELEDALYGLLVARRKAGQNDNQAIVERLLKLRDEAVRRDPDNINNQMRQLNALARCGRLVEGSRLAEEIHPKIETNDPQQYVLACSFAQLAEARRDADDVADEDLKDVPQAEEFRVASLAALRNLIDSGFHRPTDLRLDPDLDPLRDSEAFQELLRTEVPELRSYSDRP